MPLMYLLVKVIQSDWWMKMPCFVIFVHFWCCYTWLVFLLLVSLVYNCPLEWKGGVGSVMWVIMECSFRVERWSNNKCRIKDTTGVGWGISWYHSPQATQTLKKYQHLSNVVCLIVFRKPSTSFLCFLCKEVATFKVIIWQTFVL